MKAIKYSDQIIVDRGDGLENLGVSRVIGAITWPQDGAPAYYCIFGQDLRFTIKRQKPLFFIKECECPVLNDQFFEGLLKDARDLLCQEFYGVNSLGPEEYRSGKFKLFLRFMDSRSANIRIYAPDLDDWETAVSIIQSWKLAETLVAVTKQTTLGRQLGQMTVDSLSGTQIHAFYAVNALRCLIEEVENPRPSYGSWTTVTIPPDGGWA